MHFPTLVAATVLALAHLTLATPPGCLLGAINTYTNPADVKTVCQAKDLSSTVLQFCGSDAPAAMQALKDICGDAGQEIATSLPSSTPSAKPSGTASSPSGSGSGTAQSTGSANPTATGGAAPSGSGAPAASGSVVAGTPQATGAAGRMEVGVLGVVAGVVAWAL